MKLNQTIALMALVAGSFLASPAVQAQDAPKDKPPGAQGGPGGPAGVAARRPNVDKIAKDLGLTEVQTTKFKAAREDEMKNMRELRSNTTLSQDEKKAKAKTLREAGIAKMKEILTPEQLTKYQTMMPGQRTRPGAGAPPAAAEDKAPAAKKE